jgi:hypothetical protein
VGMAESDNARSILLMCISLYAETILPQQSFEVWKTT